MANTTFGLNLIEKAMDKAGMHIGCVLGIHDFNRRRICRKCRYVEAKPVTHSQKK